MNSEQEPASSVTDASSLSSDLSEVTAVAAAPVPSAPSDEDDEETGNPGNPQTLKSPVTLPESLRQGTRSTNTAAAASAETTTATQATSTHVASKPDAGLESTVRNTVSIVAAGPSLAAEVAETKSGTEREPTKRPGSIAASEASAQLALRTAVLSPTSPLGRQVVRTARPSDELTDDEDDEVFEVETIKAYKRENGGDYYLVKWANFGEEEATWEPEENIVAESLQPIMREVKAQFVVARYYELDRAGRPVDRERLASLLVSMNSRRVPEGTTSSKADSHTKAPSVSDSTVQVQPLTQPAADIALSGRQPAQDSSSGTSKSVAALSGRQPAQDSSSGTSKSVALTPVIEVVDDEEEHSNNSAAKKAVSAETVSAGPPAVPEPPVAASAPTSSTAFSSGVANNALTSSVSGLSKNRRLSQQSQGPPAKKLRRFSNPVSSRSVTARQRASSAAKSGPPPPTPRPPLAATSTSAVSTGGLPTVPAKPLSRFHSSSQLTTVYGIASGSPVAPSATVVPPASGADVNVPSSMSSAQRLEHQQQRPSPSTFGAATPRPAVTSAPLAISSSRPSQPPQQASVHRPTPDAKSKVTDSKPTGSATAPVRAMSPFNHPAGNKGGNARAAPNSAPQPAPSPATVVSSKPSTIPPISLASGTASATSVNRSVSTVNPRSYPQAPQQPPSVQQTIGNTSIGFPTAPRPLVVPTQVRQIPDVTTASNNNVNPMFRLPPTARVQSQQIPDVYVMAAYRQQQQQLHQQQQMFQFLQAAQAASNQAQAAAAVLAAAAAANKGTNNNAIVTGPSPSTEIRASPKKVRRNSQQHSPTIRSSRQQSISSVNKNQQRTGLPSPTGPVSVTSPVPERTSIPRDAKVPSPTIPAAKLPESPIPAASQGQGKKPGVPITPTATNVSRDLAPIDQPQAVQRSSVLSSAFAHSDNNARVEVVHLGKPPSELHGQRGLWALIREIDTENEVYIPVKQAEREFPRELCSYLLQRVRPPPKIPQHYLSDQND